MSKYDKAIETYRKLRELHAKRDELFRELGFCLEWARALDLLALKPEHASGVLPASMLQPCDALTLPPSSAGRVCWVRYKLRYPNAVVGAHLKDGGLVIFLDPIPARSGLGAGEAVPTYAEFSEKLKQQRERNSHG